MHTLIRLVVAVFAGLLLVTCSVRQAGAATKEECLDAHGRGQDQREKGTLSRARQSFTTCAQSTCPAVVQADCARLSEELSRMLPSVTFVARDAMAADLPATSVYVDEVLFTTRRDDGRSYDGDPGRHVVRFVHEGRESTTRVVLNQGEKGRVLVATFTAAPPPSPPPPASTVTPADVEPHRSILPLGVSGLGAAAAITGAVLVGVGMGRVPSSCSSATHECTTRGPNDSSVADAESGTALANIGVGLGLTGAAVLVGGLVWYLLQPSAASSTTSASAHARSRWDRSLQRPVWGAVSF